MNENLNINQCVGGKEGELHQSVKLAPLGLVGSNPTPHTIKKGEKLMENKCDKCGKIPASVNYKGKNYCTWYCAKKGEK